MTVFSVNSKDFGFNVASGAQCDIPINHATQYSYGRFLERQLTLTAGQVGQVTGG